jgi:hypothetical protein
VLDGWRGVDRVCDNDEERPLFANWICFFVASYRVNGNSLEIGGGVEEKENAKREGYIYCFY